MVDLFTTPEWDERLQLVLHLLNSTERIPYVRGPAGAGKSSFGALLTGKLDVGVEFVWLRAAPDTDLVRQSEQLHVGPAVDLGDTLDLLPGPVMLIDDAHRLPREQLEALPEVRRHGVRAVLFGEPVTDWAEAEFNLQYVDLPPFSDEQLSGLLTHVGFPAVPAADLATLREASEGYPGRLVRRLEQLQRDAASPATPLPKPRAPLRPLRWGIALVAVTAVLLWVIRGDWSPPSEAPVPADPPAAGTPPPPAPADVATAPGIPPPESSQVDNNQKQISESEQSLTTTTETPGDVLADGYDAWTMTPVPADELHYEEIRFAAQRPAASVRLDEVAPAAAAPSAASTAATAQAASPPSPPVAPAPPAATAPKPVRGPEPPPVAAAPVVDPGSSAASPRPAPVVKAPAASQVSAAGAQPPAANWLRARDPRRYTLQLVGARERSAVVAFVKKNEIGADHAIFERELNGKPWFSLVAGDFPDRAGAVAARAKLPPHLRDTAWPRSFQSIFAQLDPVR